MHVSLEKKKKKQTKKKNNPQNIEWLLIPGLEDEFLVGLLNWRRWYRYSPLMNKECTHGLKTARYHN